MVYTEEECIESLREAEEILGETPSGTQYKKLSLVPSHSTMMRKFGSWNEAKKKAGLDTLGKGDRNDTDIEPKPDDLELDSDEQWEELSPHQRCYRRNRDKRKNEKKERKKRIKIWFYNYKKKHCSCEKCGEEHPATLDFHHIEDKEWNISAMVRGGYSKEKIKKEMEKCEVLCVNCHRKEHFEPLEE
jgi:hypothetical protein